MRALVVATDAFAPKSRDKVKASSAKGLCELVCLILNALTTRFERGTIMAKTQSVLVSVHSC